MNKKMIYVLNHYSKESVQHFFHVINLLENIANKGVEIALIIEKCDDVPVINNDNIIVICQKEKKKINRVIEFYKILKQLIVKEGYKKIFVRISINACIISILAAKIHKAETFYWQSGSAFEYFRKMSFLKRIRWYMTDFLKNLFIKNYIDHFVTGPETMIDYYKKHLNIKDEKMMLLYNDIDTNRFSAVTNEEKIKNRIELGLDLDKVYVLIVHRLSPVRKTEFYIPFIAEDDFYVNSNIEFLLIGDGQDKSVLENQILKSSANERITMLGAKPNCIIEKYYKAVDVFINPSYTEGFPRVVIEAMGCGLPIVATDAGGTEDLFGKKQREFIVSIEDRDKFKNKLVEILKNKKLASDLGQENCERIVRYSTDNVSKMYINGVFGYGD